MRGGEGAAAAIQAAGGEVLGLFTPQIGWVARQAALLVRWGPTPRAATARSTPDARQDGRVRPARPDRADLPPDGRRQAAARRHPRAPLVPVEADNVPEFLTLSTEGWRDFETRFEANIFGLFTAERSSDDRNEGVTRLLLITRYKDHGVWEASRDPSTAAMKTFQRRAAITRDTWNASTLLVPI
jgi:hypothetical protein